MHLGGSVLIALALVAAETASPVEPRPWTVRIFAIMVGGLVVVLAASAIAGLIAGEIRSNPQGVRASLRGYAHLRRLHTAIWLVVSLTAVTVVQWPQSIELELHRLIVIDELIVLLPLLLPMVFSHAAFFEVDRAAAHVLGGDADAPSCRNRWSYAWWFARHEFGLVLLPLLALFLVRDLARLASGVEAPADFWAIALVALAAVVAGLPLWVRQIWPCQHLADDELHDAIARQCRAAGQTMPRLLKWNTGGRIVNAVVTGVLPRTQCILLSDALLRHFSREEILAVVRHELVHARRHHVLLRIAAMAAPLAACWACGVHNNALPAYESVAAMHLDTGAATVLIVAGLGLAGYAWWVFGAFSRLLEIEADLIGCRAPGQSQDARAALSKLGCVYGFDQRSWLHPTIRLRMRIVSAAERRAAFRERLLARTARWKRAILVTFIAALASCL
jgi:Zn-dependent protease with chaperone function